MVLERSVSQNETLDVSLGGSHTFQVAVAMLVWSILTEKAVLFLGSDCSAIRLRA